MLFEIDHNHFIIILYLSNNIMYKVNKHFGMSKTAFQTYHKSLIGHFLKSEGGYFMPQLYDYICWEKLVKLNIERMKNLMDENEIDVIICNGMENVRYLTGFSPFNAMIMQLTHATILIKGEELPVLYTMPYYSEYIREAVPWIKDIRLLSGEISETALDLLKEKGVKNARIVLDSFFPFEQGKKFENLVAPMGCKLVSSNIISKARSIKNPEEIKIMRKAVAISEIGMKAALKACIEGRREYEVAAEAEYVMRLAGAESPSHASIVTSGHNGEICAEISTDKRLRNGETVMLDLGCLYEGYVSEFARTAFVGRFSAEQKLAYKAVYDSLQECINAIKPGITAGEIDRIARESIKRAGFEDGVHRYGTGHGLGIAGWEAPSISPGNNDVLESGMVIAVEPGIHKVGLGGIRLEENILVTDNGCEVLTRTEFWEL